MNFFLTFHTILYKSVDNSQKVKKKFIIRRYYKGIANQSSGAPTVKVLVVEDNQQVAERIKTALSRRFVIDVVETGQEAIECIQRATSAEYSVIVLDLGLPDMTGLEVCQRIRRQKCATPILILTGIASADSTVQLLDAGADDYLTKPFNGDELRARLMALVRRTAPAFTGEFITFGDLQIDLVQHQVRRAGKLVPLPRKEFDILQYLIVNQGRAVTRAMIMDHAWTNGHDSWHGTVDVHIKRLRDKIDRPFDKPIIKTAHGVGYMVDSTRET